MESAIERMMALRKWREEQAQARISEEQRKLEENERVQLAIRKQQEEALARQIEQEQAKKEARRKAKEEAKEAEK